MRNKNIRFVYMIIVGVAINFILHVVGSGRQEQQHTYLNLIFSIIVTILVWEGNKRIDIIINKYLPWETKTKQRILIYLPVSVTYSALLIYLAMIYYNAYICEFPAAEKEKFLTLSLLISMLISIIILSVEVSVQFFKNWKSSLIEIEKYKTENIQAQLQNLKNQISPHFLFNNLSVLSSLVYQDQDKAVDFINQLSKVYRYLLDNRESQLVTLENELAFIKSYTSLLKIRFDKNINFEFNISEDKMFRLLPPMSLQMLIENAIKHNEISNLQPLTVRIISVNETLEITNNLQLRKNSEPESKTGLQNIKDRYRFYTDKPVLITQTSEQFKVQIPLLITQ